VRGRPIDQCDLAEDVARAHDVEQRIAPIDSIGVDAQSARHHAVERVACIALAEQHGAGLEAAGDAQLGDLVDYVAGQALEQARAPRS